jgi:hypothetical protein
VLPGPGLKIACQGGAVEILRASLGDGPHRDGAALGLAPGVQIG